MGVWAGCRRAGRAARSTAAMTKSPRGGRLACRGALPFCASGTGRGAFWQHGLRPGARFAPAGPQPAGGNGRRRGVPAAGTAGCRGERLFLFPSMSRHAVPARRSSVAGTFLSAGRGYAAPCAAAAFAADDYFYFRPCTGTQRPPGAAPWRAPFFRPGEGMPRPVWLQLLRRVTISISICV